MTAGRSYLNLIILSLIFPRQIRVFRPGSCLTPSFVRLFGAGRSCCWVQTTAIWPSALLFFLSFFPLLFHSVPSPCFTHPLLFLCTGWHLHIPTLHVNLFPHKSTGGLCYRKWRRRDSEAAAEIHRNRQRFISALNFRSRSLVKGKQSCLMPLPGWILHSQSAANELQRHMPNVAAWSLALFLSGCYAPGAALRQFQVQLLCVFLCSSWPDVAQWLKLAYIDSSAGFISRHLVS